MRDLVLMPFININGSWNLPDDVLAAIYARMAAENSARAFFFDGTVKDTDQFIKVCHSPNVSVTFLFTETGDPAAMGMLNNFAGHYAHAHWLTFRTIHKEEKMQAVGRMLRYWFALEKDGKPLFDILLGIYPEDNKRIDSFAKRAGFTVIGTIPGLLFNYWEKRKIGAVFSYIERRSIWDSSATPSVP